MYTCINIDAIGRVTFTYDIGVTQYDRPDFDSWTWSRWSSIGTRLIVDERPFIHTGAQSDSSIRSNQHLIGDITLTLQRGPHTARLQWRTFGESIREWTTFQTMLDGYGSSRTLLAMVHAPIIVQYYYFHLHQNLVVY